MLRVHHDVRVFASALARSIDDEAVPRALVPRTRWPAGFVPSLVALANDSGLGALYVPRIHELVLEHAIARATDKRERQRLARQRWGDGATRLSWAGRESTLAELALTLLEAGSAAAAAPAQAPGNDVDDAIDALPLARLTRFAESTGLAIRVAFEPELVADAASGEGAPYLRPRPYRVRDLVRLGAHEIHGHLIAAENARHQPLALLRIGCAGSWEDQEGTALVLEEQAGTWDAARRRTLAARVLAVLMWLDDASETEAAQVLVDEHGFDPSAARIVARRAFRAGGTARDLAYLVGYSRVRSAVDAKVADLDALRMGRVSVASLSELARHRESGLVAPPRHRPSLAKSLRETFSGTSFATSPPSRAASFTRFDDT
jgi:hypothetical protein